MYKIKYSIASLLMFFFCNMGFSQIVTDGSFEAGPFGGTWIEASTFFGTPICNIPGCGTGGGTGPQEGDFWTWFGGIAAGETGSVTQDVTIPVGTATLDFQFELPVCDGSGLDFMEVTIDGNQIFLVDDLSALCGVIGYAPQSIDISAFADGGTHTLEFRSQVFGANFGVSNFFIDNVVINHMPPPPAPPMADTPIPTMGEWALMIFGLLIVNMGVFYIRRKQSILE